MARLVVLYKTPKDVGAFDAYYFNTHVPIAKKIPGLRTYEVSKGPVVTPTGPSGVHLVATLHFDDLSAIQRAFMSPEGLGRRLRCAKIRHRRRRHAAVRQRRDLSDIARRRLIIVDPGHDIEAMVRRIDGGAGGGFVKRLIAR